MQDPACLRNDITTDETKTISTYLNVHSTIEMLFNFREINRLSRDIKIIEEGILLINQLKVVSSKRNLKVKSCPLFQTIEETLLQGKFE